MQLKIEDYYVNRILNSLKLMLPDCVIRGVPTLLDITGMTGTSARSLQRKLLVAGMTYSKLLDLARYENASVLLSSSDMKLIQVAFAAGYTDPAHFSRAFRRMSGVTPRSFRNEQRSGKNGPARFRRAGPMRPSLRADGGCGNDKKGAAPGDRLPSGDRHGGSDHHHQPPKGPSKAAGGYKKGAASWRGDGSLVVILAEEPPLLSAGARPDCSVDLTPEVHSGSTPDNRN